MKRIPFTQFRANASRLIAEVEHGETLLLTRRGEPVAEVVPVARGEAALPSWRQPVPMLEAPGAALSAAILAERETQP